MSAIADTPQPPYYAVIFTSIQTGDLEGYADMADRMLELASEQPGFLGFETARSGLGISVSYWKDEAAILNWKKNAEHLVAQRLGKEQWYAYYRLRVCKVEREYGRS